METDWSVAAGPEDPLIEAGWSTSAGLPGQIDLRVPPDLQQQRIAALPETQHAPELAHSLHLLNAPDGLLFTTKCDYWPLDTTERADTADLLDEPEQPFGIGSYIDVLFTPSVAMGDFLLHEEWARVTARRCAAAPIADARMELIVRPARRDATWGFGLTVYCYGVGRSEHDAHVAWAEALHATVPVLITAATALLPPAKDVQGPAIQ